MYARKRSYEFSKERSEFKALAALVQQESTDRGLPFKRLLVLAGLSRSALKDALDRLHEKKRIDKIPETGEHPLYKINPLGLDKYKKLCDAQGSLSNLKDILAPQIQLISSTELIEKNEIDYGFTRIGSSTDSGFNFTSTSSSIGTSIRINTKEFEQNTIKNRARRIAEAAVSEYKKLMKDYKGMVPETYLTIKLVQADTANLKKQGKEEKKDTLKQN